MKMKSALATFLLFFGFAAQAQDGPSYEETLGFLKSKLNFIDNNYSQHLLEMERCSVAMLYNYPKNDEVFVLQLSLFDPSKSRSFGSDMNGWVTIITSKENKEIIPRFMVFDNRLIAQPSVSSGGCQEKLHHSVLSDPNVASLIHVPVVNRTCFTDADRLNSRNYDIRLSVSSPERENSIRVSRAFSHLIRLCGGQEELF